MVNFYRLIFCFLGALLFCVSAFSLSPVSSIEYRYKDGPWSPSTASALQGFCDIRAVSGCFVNTQYNVVHGYKGDGTLTSFGNFEGYVQRTSVPSCPANSASVPGGGCSCSAGFVEVNGQCKEKKSDKCGQLEGQSLGLSLMEISVGVASTGALVGMVGKPGTSCFPGGCTVSGMVNGCMGGGAGGSVCFMSSPSFTGAACEEKEPDKGCPPGTTPSAYAAGVCIPDKNDCPPGYSPSKYAAGVCIPDENPCPPGRSPSKYVQGVCLPDDDPNANGDKGEGKKNDCPKGYVPSKYVAGLCIPATTTTDKDGTTTCIGEVCTTTKPNGDKEEKPKDQFCAESPDSPLCVKGEFAGTCGAGFTCKGDAIQCAIGQEQHRRACKLFDDESAESKLYMDNKGKTGNQTVDLPGNETISLAGRIDSSDALAAGSAGVSDLNVTVWGQAITLPFSMINPYLAHLGNILLAVSFLLALRIVARG